MHRADEGLDFWEEDPPPAQAADGEEADHH